MVNLFKTMPTLAPEGGEGKPEVAADADGGVVEKMSMMQVKR